MESLKEYWQQIVAAVLVILGFGKLRWDIESLKSKKLVEEAACKERQNSCGKINDVQFQAGEDRFASLEKAIIRMEDKQDQSIIRMEERQIQHHREFLNLIKERLK